MSCISNDDIYEVDWQKSARTGYTKIVLAAQGYFAEHKRRNQAVWQPTDDDATAYVKTELDPMLRDVVAMFNMSRSLLLMGFGVDQTDIILTAEKGIREYTERIQKTGSYTLKASEITMLKDLLELHDAQMEVVTVGDVQKAIDNAKREFQGGKCTRLSTKYIGEPA
jgi:hypothetical protein